MKLTQEKDFEITKQIGRINKQPKLLKTIHEVVDAIARREAFVYKFIWAKREGNNYSIFNYEKPIFFITDVCGVQYKFLNTNKYTNTIIFEIHSLFKEINFELYEEDFIKIFDNKKLQYNLILNSPLPIL